MKVHALLAQFSSKTRVFLQLIAYMIFAITSTGCALSLINLFSFHPVKIENNVNYDKKIIALFPDIRISEHKLKTKDAVTIHGLLLESPNTQRTILFLHGNAGHAYQRLPQALMLYKKGFNVLLLSYRGYGKSNGSPTEQGVYIDANAGIEFLTARGYPLQALTIYGRSLGAAVAIDAATRYPVNSLVLISPFSSGKDMAKHMGLSFLNFSNEDPFNSREKIKLLTMPTLIVHGQQDQLVPMAMAKTLYKHSPAKRKEFYVIKKAGHNNIHIIGDEELISHINEFITNSTLPTRRGCEC